MEMIQKLLNDYLDIQRTVATDLDALNPRVRNAWVSAIAEAKAKLPTVQKEWENLVLQNSVAIFLSGNNKQKFIDIADDTCVDASHFYQQIAAVIEPMLGPERHIAPSQVATILDRFKTIARDFGIKDLDPSKVEEFPVLKTENQIVDYVRDIVRANYGDILTKAYVAKQAADAALEKRYKGGTLPVIIINATESEVASLSAMFGKPAQIVHLHPEVEVNEKFVTEVFNTIKKKLRASKQTQTETNSQN